MYLFLKIKHNMITYIKCTTLSLANDKKNISTIFLSNRSWKKKNTQVSVEISKYLYSRTHKCNFTFCYALCSN